MTIPSIPTDYNGILFRSRLEARWAVFMDALKLEYRYEPKQFRLPSGNYTPDFLLPQYNVWLEIKPTAPDAEAIHKVTALAKQVNNRVYLLAGEVEMPANKNVLPGLQFQPNGSWLPGFWWAIDDRT